MTDVEYDSDAMRIALKELRQALRDLEDLSAGLSNMSHVLMPPGGSDQTKKFHNHLTDCSKVTIQNHQTGQRQLAESINALIAIDKEYNNGEIVNELGLKKVKGPGK